MAQRLHRYSRKEVQMKHLIAVSAALLVTTLCPAEVAHAQAAQGGAGSAAEAKTDKGGNTTSKERREKGELERCKEKAQGLDGPERARFMTDCLRGPGKA
jgi:hypothetical protein